MHTSILWVLVAVNGTMLAFLASLWPTAQPHARHALLTFATILGCNFFGWLYVGTAN